MTKNIGNGSGRSPSVPCSAVSWQIGDRLYSELPGAPRDETENPFAIRGDIVRGEFR